MNKKRSLADIVRNGRISGRLPDYSLNPEELDEMLKDIQTRKAGMALEAAIDRYVIRYLKALSDRTK